MDNHHKILVSMYSSLILWTLLFCGWGTSSMISCWIVMELMNFIFIPWMMWSENDKYKVFIYFIMQAFASSIFVISLFMINNGSFFTIVNISSILFKLGSFPFHLWVIMTIEGLNWETSGTMLTIMKGLPYMILFFLPLKSNIIIICMIGLMVSLGGVSSNSLRSILSYSSINHTSWMVVTSLMSKWLMMAYFLIYSVMTLSFCYLMKRGNLFSFKQLKNSSMILIMTISILNMSGIPPFMGFLPKLFTLKQMIQMNFILESILFILLSIIPVYM
uniref:NADH-ubiquinone oxidoreductase chain 2 n=1 Tax=Amyrsidea minuta TaxID=2364307 RepID=A0A386B2D2_9NEOP|nr:NADH dehydrogenase subunit 2 [Amyrsidea minuta]